LTDIFYFTGTGFTLHAADMIKSELGEGATLRPIVEFLATGQEGSSAETIGLVMPMHAFGLPDICRRFLKRAQFPKATYVFALIVRGGAPSLIRGEIDGLLSRQGKHLHAFMYATTVNTFDIVSVFPVPPTVGVERARFESDILKFASAVRRQDQSIDLGYRNLVLENFLFPLIRAVARATRYFNLEKDLYAEPSCIGCSTCERLCPAGKIYLANGKPIWDPSIKCEHCLACIHRCPVKAIQIRHTQSKTLERLFCPEVSVEAIAAQKASLPS